MASYFNLTLKTTAPTGLSLLINDGAQYTTSVAVTLKIVVADEVTTGYQMKIWGTSTVANEEAAAWESYATSKSISLPDGDGLKTVYIKVRDNVGNETAATNSSITLDTAVPTVTITGPDVTVISKVTGFDECAFSFMSDVAFDEYVVKVVPSNTSLHTAGTQIPSTAGSTHMSGAAGGYPADTAISCTIKGADLETASAGDGAKIVKVFVRNAAGNWSTV